MTEFVCDLITAFSNCFRNCCVPYKLAHMTFPRVENNTLTQVHTTEMHHVLVNHFEQKPKGVTILCAPKGCGKTHTLAYINPTKVMYWDCSMYPDFESMFFNKLGLHQDFDKELLLEFCNCLKYTNLVLDHFESIHNERFLDYMCKKFSILIVCDTDECAQRLLHDRRPRATILKIQSGRV